MSKVALVAQRELLENVRTKTFWIGILAVPLMIVIAIVVARLMHEAKDVRSYAVLDLSEGQWMSRAIEARAAANDVERVQEQLAEAKKRRLPADPAELAARLREERDRLPSGDPRAELIDIQLSEPELLQQMAGKEVGEVPALIARNPRVAAWFLQVMRDPAKLANLRGLDALKYRQVRYDDLGDDPEAARQELQQKLQSGALFAYFVIPQNPTASDADALYVSNNVTDSDLQRWYGGLATQVVREQRVRDLQLSKDDAQRLMATFDFQSSRISAEGKVEEVKVGQKAAGMAPVAFVYLLWIAIFSIAQMLLTNTIEEKSNRIIEVLLSSVSPFQLMAGKIFGIAATGLAIIMSWVLFALVAVKMLPLFFDNTDQFPLTAIVGDPRYIASFAGYFLAGYLIYASALVAIGSVCNSLKEAQHLMQPVVILLIVPLIAMFPVVEDPNGPLARVLTYVPLFTPFLMMNRAAGPPPAWEYVATTILILVTIAVAFWAAGKIFRIGVLMTGKPPKVREILRWLRTSPGVVPPSKQPTG